MKQTSSEKRFAAFEIKCRENGLRVTPQRVAIYEELLRARTHPTAEQVHAKVKKRFSTISLNTVNQTLLTFTQVGIADIAESFGGPRRYDASIKMHHHVHCLKCGAILDFYDDNFDQLKISPKLAREFKILGSRVVLAGICKSCSNKPK